MIVQLLTDPNDKEKVYQFRYKVYVEEMQRKQNYCDHATQSIIEPFDDTANIFAAFDQHGHVMGTVRTNYSRYGNIGYYEDLYRMHSVGSDHPKFTSITTKLMVAKEYRNTTIPRALIFATYKMAIADGIKFDFIDANIHLVRLFERLGYIALDKISHPEYGDVMLMKNPLKDAEHLQKVKSPFYQILINHLEKQSTRVEKNLVNFDN